MWKLLLAVALTAATAVAAPEAATAPLVCPGQCQCEPSPQCPAKRAPVPRGDCFQCCDVCGRTAGEECDGLGAVCAAHLQCVDTRCTDLPKELRPSNNPITVLHFAPINSSAAEIFVRVPEMSQEPLEPQFSLSPKGPWNPVSVWKKMPAWDENTFVVQVGGLKGKEVFLRVVQAKLWSKGVKVVLAANQEKSSGGGTMRKLLAVEEEEKEAEKAAVPCMYEGKAFNPGEAYLSMNCTERCECNGKGVFNCKPTSPETSSACSKTTDLSFQILTVVDSSNDTLTLSWRGQPGMILQFRAEGTNDPWQRTERLTPDGTQEAATITIESLTSLTTYEVRTVLPGQDEEGRSARGEDLPVQGTTKPMQGMTESGFCVVLGKKIPSGEEIPNIAGGCSEQKCTCQPGQPPLCRQRCNVPFFRRGAFSQDEQCTEKPSPDDTCCVILQCTDHDAEEAKNPCDQCAENTECHKSAAQTDEALCMCKDGHVGDPYDKEAGCKPTSALLASSAKEVKEVKKCVFKNNSYSMGQLFYDGCKQQCVCNSKMEIDCEPRCSTMPDKAPEGCQIVTNPEDVCCKMVKCDENKSEKLTTGVTYSEGGAPTKGCVYKDKQYKKGQSFVDGCEKNCTCTQTGEVSCKPRCKSPATTPSDKCVTVPDPSDVCCTMVLCDVTLEESNESRNPQSSIEAEEKDLKGIDIDGVKVFNSSTVRLIAHLPGNLTWQQGLPELAVFYAKEQGGPWSKVPVISSKPGAKSDLEIYASGLPSGKINLRVENGDFKSREFSTTLPSTSAAPGKECEYKGKTYKINEEFHDGCAAYCACTKTGIQCADIECPTDFALDVLDPYCLDWEREPGFVAVPPRCCPDMRCKSNGTCHYKGEMFDNYAEIPTKITGCEERCYCEFGNVTCSPACPPVPATPPLTIGCQPTEARLSHLPGEDCCLYWLCPRPQDGRPPGDEKAQDTNNQTTTIETKPEIFMPTPLPDEAAPKTKDKNAKAKDNKSPLVLNPELSTNEPPSALEPINGAVPPTPFTPPKSKGKEPFLGPYAPDFKGTPFLFHGEPMEHGFLGPVPNVPNVQNQKPPPAQKNKRPQDVDGHIDPQFLEDLIRGTLDHRTPQPRPPQRPPLRGPPDLNQDPNKHTIAGLLPAHILQGANNNPNPQGANIPVDSSGRPILSPIAAHIEQHFQSHPGGQGRPQGPPFQGPPFQGRPPQHPGHFNEQAPPNDYDEHYIFQNGQLVPFNPANFQPPNAQNPILRGPPLPQQPPHFGEHVLIARNDTQLNDPDTLSSNSHEKTTNKVNPQDMFGMHFKPHQGNEISLMPPVPLSPRSVRLVFQIPSVFVGLHGRVEVRYTDDASFRDDDPMKWEKAATATDEIIDGVQMAHEVSGLKPDSEYRFQVAIKLRDLDNTLLSHVATVRTPSATSTMLPPIITIDAGLAVSQVNSSWIKVSWRKFSEYELQFIDGVQIRFKERDSQVYRTTPLIHRLVDSYVLENLKPGTEYEVNIIFLPFHGQETELQAERAVQATTAPALADPFGFDLAVTVAMVKANSVELSWTGVPYPEDKYVNIYRAIYQSDVEANKQELSSTFKLAKRDGGSNRTRTVVQALKPNTRYRIWLEAYMTNGKIKKSDVRTFTTKPGLLPSAGASERVAEQPRGDYYGALVGVSIFAALALVALVILLMVMVRRQHSVTANITSRGKSEAAFDNPSFKNSDEPATVTNGSSKRTTQEEA